MNKKLSQNLIVAINAISFGGAAIFGGIGIFAAISNFTKGSWYIYGGAFEGLIGSVATSFFLAVLALAFGLLAKFTIKKITSSDLLKKAYVALSVVSKILTVFFVAVAVSVAIYALIGVGSDYVSQKDLWLNGFLAALISAAVAGAVAMISHKVASEKITILPLATHAVLGVASLSLLLMIISTIVNLYGNGSSSSSYSDSLNELNDLFNMFY